MATKVLSKLRFLGRHAVLNFANTVDPREGAHQTEYLHDYRDLLAWVNRAGLFSASRVRRFARLASRDRSAAERAFRQALHLREAIYRVFAAVATRRPVEDGDIETVLTDHREALAHSALRHTRRRFAWELADSLHTIRWQIAREAVSLLETGALHRVKRCPGCGDCGWLFLDTSKNATARWCSMEGCGNRAKVRRYLRRRKRASPRTKEPAR